MFAALWLPRFQLQAVLRAQPMKQKKPLVVLLDETSAGSRDKERILHASEAAEHQGIHAGMTASQAQARYSSLLFLHRDAVKEAEAQRELLQCASEWTPDHEATLPGCCVLDLRRRREAAGLEQANGLKICEQLRQRQLDVRVGFAANADLAMLAAQAARPVIVLRHEDDEARFLHELPVSVLRPSADVQAVLALWGVRTLGGLIKLPRADVTARLGREGRLLWDMAAGGRQRLLKLVRPAVDFHEEMDLEHPVECLEPLLFILRRMLQGLCERLADVWLVAASLLLTLRFEDKTEHQRELHVAEPVRDVELLFRVLHVHLDGLSAAAPIAFVALAVRPVRPAGSQGQLFERALRDPNRFAETLTQLEALLGAGCVGRACLLRSRRTDAFQIVGFSEPMSDTSNIIHKPAGMPLRRLRPSPTIEVRLVQGRPGEFRQGRVHHIIAHAEGPWLLSGDWWDANTRWDKEVWAVQTDDGTIHQLARQNGVWLLEGTLG